MMVKLTFVTGHMFESENNLFAYTREMLETNTLTLSNTFAKQGAFMVPGYICFLYVPTSKPHSRKCFS